MTAELTLSTANWPDHPSGTPADDRTAILWALCEIVAPELPSRRWTFATHDDGVVNSGLDITFFESPPGAAVTPAVPAPPAPVPPARFTTNIVNAADAALRSGAAGCAGLYRTTLLSHEKFGAGRPDVRTTLRAGRISFRCLVEEVTTA